MSTIPTRITDRLLGFLSGKLQATPEPVVPSLPSGNGTSPLINRSMSSAWERYVTGNQTRLMEMQCYDFLENEMAEVPKSLDAFATMACTGTLTGTERANFVVNVHPDAPAALQDRMEAIEAVINRECFSIIRGMAKFGSYPVQIVTAQDRSTRRVADLNHIPPSAMERNPGDTDGSRYWKRRFEGDSKGTYLPRWMIPHFAIWSQAVTATRVRMYGVSMLQPVMRLALQYGASIDAMVVARLTRAAQRFGIGIDIADIAGNQEAIISRIAEYQKLYERERQVFRGGKQDSFQRASVPDGDIYYPAGKNLGYDVKTLSGDANVGNIKDLEFLMRCYLGALGVPPQYLGHAGESGGRSGLSQVDIQFARSSRYLQMFACIAFEHVVQVDMILGGYDPELYEWSVSPPSIGARDELLNAQISMLRSQVLANLVNAGLDPSEDVRWVLEVLLNMKTEIQGLDDATLNRLFKPLMASGNKGTGTSRPDRMNASRESIRAVSKGTQQFVRNIREIMAWEAAGAMAMPNPSRKNAPTARDLMAGIHG